MATSYFSYLVGIALLELLLFVALAGLLVVVLFFTPAFKRSPDPARRGLFWYKAAIWFLMLYVPHPARCEVCHR